VRPIQRTRKAHRLPEIIGPPADAPRTAQPGPPPPLTNQDSPQSLTAGDATELLPGRARGLGERFITAWPPAAEFPGLFRVGIALALDFAAAGRVASGPLAFTHPLPVAAGLFPATALPLFAGPITAVRRLLSPPPRRFTTSRTAIAGQRVPRTERLLAAFQQTDAATQSPRKGLHPADGSITLRLGHGEVMLPAGQVSLRSANFAARRLIHPPFISCGRPNLPQ